MGQTGLGCCHNTRDKVAENNRHLFLSVLEAEKFKVKLPADPVSGESPVPGLQMTILLYPHVTESGERDQALCLL